MKQVAFIFSFFFLVACNSQKDNAKDKEKHTVHKHEQGKEVSRGSANEHMHQSSVDDLIKRFESPERDAYQQPEKVMAYLGDIEGQTIIDIGAGSGYFSVKLAEKGAYVIAADVDDEFQEFLNNRIEKNDLMNIETRKIPYDGPGLKEHEVDKVVLVNTYHHIENRPDYFSKVKTGTKPDGELVIIDFFKAEISVGPPLDHKVAIDQVIQELKKAKYTSFNVNVELLPYQYIIRAK